MCPKSYFCRANVSVPALCPADYYCPAESAAPLPCPPAYSCPAGSAAPVTVPSTNAVGLVWVIALSAAVVFLLLVYVFARCRWKGADPGALLTAGFSVLDLAGMVLLATEMQDQRAQQSSASLVRLFTALITVAAIDFMLNTVTTGVVLRNELERPELRHWASDRRGITSAVCGLACLRVSSLLLLQSGLPGLDAKLSTRTMHVVGLSGFASTVSACAPGRKRR